MGGLQDRYIVMPNNRFLVEVENCPISFARISNIQSAVEYDTITEGGLNGRVHTFVKPASQAQTLVLEKGITLAGADSLKNLKLVPGRMLALPIEIRVKANGVKGRRDPLVKSYRVADCMLVKWELGGLDAMSNEVLIERFEVVHGGITEI